MRTPPTDPTDAAELERLETAIRNARARRSQFLRDLSGRSRKREMQRLCTLGRALEALCEQHPGWQERYLMPFLRGYISRDTDRAALAGTRFDVGGGDGIQHGEHDAPTDEHRENAYPEV